MNESRLDTSATPIDPDDRSNLLVWERWLRRALYVPLGIILALTLIKPFILFFGLPFYPDGIMDDAYMFVRYADHLLKEGSICWNSGAPPVFGLTSLSHLFWVVLVRWFIPDNAFQAMTLSSLIPGWLCVAALTVLIHRHASAGPRARTFLLFAFLMAFHSAYENHWMMLHFHGGMETCLAMLHLTLYLIAFKQWERTPTAFMTGVTGALGGLFFLTRPDLLLFTVLVPGAVWLLGEDPARRRRCLWVLGIGVGLLIVQTAAAWLYFGTPVPLSFHAKCGNLYGPTLRDVYAPVPRDQLWEWIRVYAVVAVPAGIYGLALLRRRMASRDAMEFGVFLATAAFLVYYLFFVLQIMFIHQRFYMPVLPAVIFLAVQGAARLMGFLDGNVFQASRATCLKTSAVAALLAVLSVFVPLDRRSDPAAPEYRRSIVGELVRWTGHILNGLKTHDYAKFDIVYNYYDRWAYYWFRLDAFSRLPDDLVIATTEVGYPAAMNPGKVIIDLAGLNEPLFAFRGFSAEELFERHKPDLIYMPHPHYAEMTADLKSHPYFQQAYTYYSGEELGGMVFGIALWKDGPHYQAMRRLVDEARTP